MAPVLYNLSVTPVAEASGRQKCLVGDIVSFFLEGITDQFQELVKLVVILARHLYSHQHTSIGCTVVTVVEHGDIPASAQQIQESHQCARALRKLKTENPLDRKSGV